MGFNFNNNTINLDIAGKKFNIDYDTTLIKAIEDFSKNAEEKSKLLKTSLKDGEYTKKLNESIKLMKDLIDTICGEGACKEIFEGRKENYFDYVDVIDYIYEEIHKFKENNKDRFNKYTSQRALRK